MVEVQGDFDEGDVVECVDKEGVRIAVGQVDFSATEARRIARKRNSEIETILGKHDERHVMVHRDNISNYRMAFCTHCINNFATSRQSTNF